MQYSHCRVIWFEWLSQAAWLPANYAVFTRLGEDKVSQPANAVYVISVDVSCGEIWKVLLQRIKGPRSCPKSVRVFDGLIDVWFVKPPKF